MPSYNVFWLYWNNNSMWLDHVKLNEKKTWCKIDDDNNNWTWYQSFSPQRRAKNSWDCKKERLVFKLFKIHSDFLVQSVCIDWWEQEIFYGRWKSSVFKYNSRHGGTWRTPFKLIKKPPFLLRMYCCKTHIFVVHIHI